MIFSVSSLQYYSLSFIDFIYNNNTKDGPKKEAIR